MWKKIKDILCKHTASKDETSMLSIDGTITTSVIDLRPSPTSSFQRPEAFPHQPLSKLASQTLNKTNEHCRSLFNLLPTSFRPRHHHRHQTLTKRGIDASTITTPTLPSRDILETDYDSGYMSQNLLNRAPSYTSCYSTGTTLARSSRSGSIENFLHGHSKANPAQLQVLVRKNFEPFAQAHIPVAKGAIVTALFSRGPWLYIRLNTTGQTGYIPRMICSTLHEPAKTDLLSSSAKPPIHRYLSHSSAIINHSQEYFRSIPFAERDRRNTYTVPRQPRPKEPSLPSHSTLSTTRDTDSSSTQDSGFSDSTPFFLFQQEDRAALKENDVSKRHSVGLVETKKQPPARRLPEFALIRNVRRDSKPTITNLPKSHIQIPASIFLNHHRQKQQFGSSHSAFRPVQSKRASSEGHSPSSPSSISSSNSSLNLERRRLSFDLTRSVYDPNSSPKRMTNFSRTMSEILCDQFSEINLDAIEKDSLIQQQPRKSRHSPQCLYTIVKDYRSSRASFAVKRGELVFVLKQIGRTCYLVRKQSNGQIGFLPKTLVLPASSTRIETFLETHGYRETII